MKKYDVIVIGAGFSGLLTAIFAAEMGYKVAIISTGNGNVNYNEGTIDLLGYYDNTIIYDPYNFIEKNLSNHPYSIINIKYIKDATDKFLTLLNKNSYQYYCEFKNKWIPTIIGTFKQSFLFPLTFNSDELFNRENIIILNIKGLKDFYPELLVTNIKKFKSFRNKKFEILNFEENIGFERDLSIVDFASWLDNIDNQNLFINKLKQILPENNLVLLPQIFGTMPNYNIYNKFKIETKCDFLELIGLPPAVSGIRLYNLLQNLINKMDITYITNSTVVKSYCNDNYCNKIITEAFGKSNEYTARYYVLATGGFYGGGLVSNYPGEVNEPIFNLNIKKPEKFDDWTTDIFDKLPQPFAKIGIMVNENLQPINKAKEVMLKNVFVVGRNLADFDPSYEKSGYGVSLSSAFKAAIIIKEGLKNEL